MPQPRHIHETYIKASPDVVWNALIDPDFTEKYYYGCRFQGGSDVGSTYAYVGELGTTVDGSILESEPFRRLVMSFHVNWDEEARAESPSNVTFELTPLEGITRLSIVHSDFGGLSKSWALTNGGWPIIAEGLKTLVETGEPIGMISNDRTDADLATVNLVALEHREKAVEINNATWGYIGNNERTPEDDEAMIRSAYAAAYHWALAANRTDANDARAEWLVSRVHAITGRGDTALHHAKRCMAAVERGGLADFDLAFAYEALARSYASLGRLDDARATLHLAREVQVADDEDREIVDGDLSAEPWFGI